MRRLEAKIATHFIPDNGSPLVTVMVATNKIYDDKKPGKDNHMS